MHASVNEPAYENSVLKPAVLWDHYKWNLNFDSLNETICSIKIYLFDKLSSGFSS